MRRLTTALIATMLVVGTLAAVPMAGLAQTETQTETPTPTNETDDGNETANATAPGAQLAGVVSVQEAELEGEVDSRAFGIRVAQAATNDSKAAVVAEQLGDLEARMNELEDRREALEQARANGSMSEGEYRAKTARLAAETQTVERLANQSNETAQDLPAETLEANGINVTAIQTLRDRADELSGPEVAAIAQSIAGPSAGAGFGPERAEDRRPDRNETDGEDRGADERDGANETATPDRTNETTETPDQTNETTTTTETADGDQQSTETTTDTGSGDETTATETDGTDGGQAGGQGR